MPDPADEPALHLYEQRGPGSLDFASAGISTVIWATGFGPGLDWLPQGALDERGRPGLPGLHVIGAPWLTAATQRSGLSSSWDFSSVMIHPVSSPRRLGPGLSRAVEEERSRRSYAAASRCYPPGSPASKATSARATPWTCATSRAG